MVYIDDIVWSMVEKSIKEVVVMGWFRVGKFYIFG